MKLRKEFDSIGSVNVPNDKYWGASTQRSNKFFNIGKILVNISIIKSIAIIKRSAAIVHYRDMLITNKISKAIIKASDEVIQGKLDENFPLKVWQTGSGTQTNMNVNEVIANRAIEILLLISLSFEWTIAADLLIIAIDLIIEILTRILPILKNLLDRCVDAPQYLSLGTLTLPILSNSFLNFID